VLELLAPLLAGVVAALVLSPLRLSGLAAAGGFFTVVYLTGHLGLEQKVLLVSAAAALLGALADLAFRPTRAAGVVLGIAFGVAAFWVFISTLGYIPANRLVLHAVGIAAFVAVTVFFSMVSHDEPPRAGAAGVGLGVASGTLAFLGGAKVLALWGFGLAAGCAGFLLVAMVLGRRIFPGASLTLTVGVVGSLLAVTVGLQRGLPWYYVALLSLVPLAVRLPTPRHSRGQAAVALLYALGIGGAACVMASIR
jgi:hypothetical protein